MSRYSVQPGARVQSGFTTRGTVIGVVKDGQQSGFIRVQIDGEDTIRTFHPRALRTPREWEPWEIAAAKRIEAMESACAEAYEQAPGNEKDWRRYDRQLGMPNIGERDAGAADDPANKADAQRTDARTRPAENRGSQAGYACDAAVE